MIVYKKSQFGSDGAAVAAKARRIAMKALVAKHAGGNCLAR
jgi:hypothetical protein